MKKETKVWLDLAKEDYQDMKIMERNKRYRGAVLFAQQTVEKILKAYIVEYKNVAPRHTHNIELLVKDASLNLNEIDDSEIAELTLAYTRVRYADMSRIHYNTKKEVESLLKIAEKIYLWVKDKLENN